MSLKAILNRQPAAASASPAQALPLALPLGLQDLPPAEGTLEETSFPCKTHGAYKPVMSCANCIAFHGTTDKSTALAGLAEKMFRTSWTFSFCVECGEPQYTFWDSSARAEGYTCINNHHGVMQIGFDRIPPAWVTGNRPSWFVFACLQAEKLHAALQKHTEAPVDPVRAYQKLFEAVLAIKPPDRHSAFAVLFDILVLLVRQDEGSRTFALGKAVWLLVEKDYEEVYGLNQKEAQTPEMAPL